MAGKTSNIQIILTPAGMNFLIQRKMKISKYPNPEGGFDHGITLNNFMPAFIQKILLEGFVSKIEISSTEFTSKRQEIIDLTKLIVYGILYKQFNTSLYLETILESAVIKNFNRSNPGSIIDERTRFDRRVVDSFLKSNAEKITFIKKSILSPVAVILQGKSDLQPDERNKKYQICEKFLDSLPKHVWYILINFQTNRDFIKLMSEIRSNLLQYLEKTTVAEYLALMLIELLQYSQNKNIQNFVQQRFSNTLSLQTLVSDSQIRQKVLAEMARQNEKLYLSWKMASMVSAKSERNKLEVVIFNRESEYKRFKEEIEDKKDVNLKKKNIIDFCRELPDTLVNPELGFLYLSYLSEECKRVNIRFDSYVHQLPQSGFTVITSTLHV